MIRDMIEFVVLIGMFIAIPIAAAALALFLFGPWLRKISRRECPHCLEWISKDAWRLSIPCPECGTPLEPGERSRTDRSLQSCRRCSEHVLCRTIWDGHPYCMRCLSEASSELLAAAESAILVDSLPNVPWRVFRWNCLFFGGLTGVIAAVGLVRGQGWQSVLQTLPPMLLLGSLATLRFTLAAAIVRLRTMVWNGLFLVRFGDRIVAAPLIRCAWKEGTIQQMVGWKLACFLRGQVLLVELPAETKGRLRRVPVGFTDESRSLWRAFFELADVPRTSS